MEGRSRAYDSEPSLGADMAAKMMSSKEFTCSLLNYKKKKGKSKAIFSA